MKNHLLIAGTGRAGTSLLVKYLTELGLETHVSVSDVVGWSDDANAGLEDKVLHGNGKEPYVIKSPWLFQSIDEILASDDVKIDGVIIPIRDLSEAASSRTILELQNIHSQYQWFTEEMAPWQAWGTTPGGTVYSLNPLDQARLLAVGFHHLVERLVKAEVPIYLVAFPRFAEEPEYLYRALNGCLPSSVTKEAAIAAHNKLVDRKKVRVKKEIGGEILASPEHAPSLEKADNAALRRELVKSRAAHAATEEMLRRAITAGQSAASEVTALQTQLMDAQNALANRSEIISLQHSEVTNLQSEIRGCHERIEMLYSSTSWRMTSPLRSIVNATRGVLRFR